MAPAPLERHLLRVRNSLVHHAGLQRTPVGRSARELAWRRDTARLWRYQASGERVGPPIVIVHSLISKSYVLDLLPGTSLIGFLLDEGFDVFLLDWDLARPADAENTLENYVEDYLPGALAAACVLAGADDVTLMGYCMGGVLALLYAAAGTEPPVRNLVTLTTPCTFAPMGFMSNMFLEGRLDPDDVIDATGLVPAEVIDAGFWLLKPTDDIVQSVNVWERGWDSRWLGGFSAMNRWARDQIPFPGAAFAQVVQTLIRDDALASGVMPLGGRDIRLADIRAAFLNVFCRDDQLVPPDAARPLSGLVGAGDGDELELDSGHVGLVAGSAARHAQPRIAEWIHARSDDH